MLLKTGKIVDDKSITIVLDDDPTGVQTIHDVYVYTSTHAEDLDEAIRENTFFFILTNSRAFTKEETAEYHRKLITQIICLSQKYGKEPIIISRSDSTLRGHYPLECDCITEAFISNGYPDFDAEFLIPAFFECGRITENEIHYLVTDGKKTPCGETEFAKDKSFGYHNSNLREWIQEKSNNRIKAEDCISFSPGVQTESEMLQKLSELKNHAYVIVNSSNYEELDRFSLAVRKSIVAGKRFLFRTAASFVKSFGEIDTKHYLEKKDIIRNNTKNAGLVFAGSHVDKTTRQLKKLENAKGVLFYTFNQHRALEKGGLEEETNKAVLFINENIGDAETIVILTNRKRIDAPENTEEANLQLANKISHAITSIVSSLKFQPNYIIAKGGITSSEIGISGLHVKKALVLGQIEKGIPVWQLGPEAKFPNMPYIIFPGNVGEDDTLVNIIKKLNA